MKIEVKAEHTAHIRTEQEDLLTVPLFVEGERQAAVLTIDGVSYHLERISCEQLTSEYRVDLDPDYQPQADAEGFCYILAPFAA